MDDAFRMGRLEGFAGLVQQPANPTRREPAIALQQHIQRDSLDVLHDDAWPLGVIQRGIVQSHGVGMLEACHDQRFAGETLAELGVGGNMVVHDLDDHLPAKVGLAGEVDLAHASFAEQADGFIPTQKNAALHGTYPHWLDRGSVPPQV